MVFRQILGSTATDKIYSMATKEIAWNQDGILAITLELITDIKTLWVIGRVVGSHHYDIYTLRSQPLTHISLDKMVTISWRS